MSIVLVDNSLIWFVVGIYSYISMCDIHMPNGSSYTISLVLLSVLVCFGCIFLCVL